MAKATAEQVLFLANIKSVLMEASKIHGIPSLLTFKHPIPKEIGMDSFIIFVGDKQFRIVNENLHSVNSPKYGSINNRFINNQFRAGEEFTLTENREDIETRHLDSLVVIFIEGLISKVKSGEISELTFYSNIPMVYNALHPNIEELC